MCLIAYAQKDKSQIPNANLTRAYARNSDAWGIMFPDGERVRMAKDTSKLDDFFQAWRAVPENTPVASHFRYATNGSKTQDMAHPFDVLGDGRVGMMHNGVIRNVGFEKEMSDTWLFVRDVIRPQLELNVELIEVDAWRHMVSGFIGTGSKLLFMLWDGRTFIINDKQGQWEKGGVWYSNTYSIDPAISQGHGVPSRFHQAPYYGNHSHGYNGGLYGDYGHDGETCEYPIRTSDKAANSAGAQASEETATTAVVVASDGTAKLTRVPAKVETLAEIKERITAKATENRRKAEAAIADAKRDHLVQEIEAGFEEEVPTPDILTGGDFWAMSEQEIFDWVLIAIDNDDADAITDLITSIK